MNPVQQVLVQFGFRHRGKILEAFHVPTGHEVIARALQHHAAHVIVRLAIVQRIAQRRAHFHAQGITRLGPVHRQRSDIVFDRDFQVSHDVFLFGRFP